MADVRPEDFGAVPVAAGKARPEDFGATPVSKALAPLPGSSMAEVAAETPEWERRAAAVGRSMSEPFESVGQFIEHLTGRGAEADKEAQDQALRMKALYKASPAAEHVKTAADITSGFLLPGVKAAEGAGFLAKTLAGAATGAGYSALSPVTSGGDFATEKAKQVGWGAGIGGGLGALSGIIDPVKRLVSRFGPKETPGTKPISEHAGKVTDELQRIRDVMEGRAKPLEGPAGSEYEHLKLRLDEVTEPMRKRAFASPDKVDAAPTLAMIEKLEEQNPELPVRAALNEVRTIIKNATESATSTARLPAAGTPVSRQELLALQGKVGQFSVEMADKVRLGIKTIIERKGERSVDKHTQNVLGQVRDDIISRMPESYKTYLTEYAKGAKALDKFFASESPLHRLTAEGGAFERVAGTDAQNLLETVFKGKTPRVELKHLVDATKHNPQALEGLKKSYAEWVTKLDPTTNIATPGTLLGHWEKTRDAVEKSGLFTPEHVGMINNVADDLRKELSRSRASKITSSIAGFLVGMPAGHPFMGSHFAGKLSMDAAKAATTEQIEQTVMTMAMDPAGAELLTRAPTPSNINALKEWASKFQPQWLSILDRSATWRRDWEMTGKLVPDKVGGMLEKSLPAAAGRREGEQQPASQRRLQLMGERLGAP